MTQAASTSLHARAIYLEAEAEVRYWEGATVNGVEDEAGTLIPFRFGAKWCPTIRLADGVFVHWPKGTAADIHYKVCDAGEYWLSDEDGRIAKWAGFYVPGDFLCHGDQGYGDYIILKVDADGRIQNYRRPDVVEACRCDDEDEGDERSAWTTIVRAAAAVGGMGGEG